MNNDASPSTTPSASGSPTIAVPSRPLSRRVLRLLLIYVVFPYVAVFCFFGVMQRQLMYAREKVAPIAIEASGLPADRIEALTLKTRDGLILNGWRHSAELDSSSSGDEPPGPSNLPVVLYFPGNAGNRLHRVQDCREFARLGCEVYLFDWRGYADNLGAPSEELLIADAQSVWQFVTSDRRHAPGKVVIFGESLGGAVAIALTAELCRLQTPPAALILNSTFSSMGDVVEGLYPYFPFRWILLDRYESAQRICDVSCPLLMFHGAKDELVPILLAHRLFTAAQPDSQNGIRKELVEFPLLGHNDIPASMLQSSVRQLLTRLASLEKPEE